MRDWAIAILCLVGIVLFAAPRAVVADDYPTRPIHLIITTPAGSLIDVLGRLLAEGLSQRLGQPVVVDNRPGGMTQARHGRAGSRRSGRLHADDRPIRTHDAAVPEKELSLRCHQGRRSGRTGHDVMDGVRDLSGTAGTDAAAIRRLRQGASRQASLWQRRRRRRAAYRGRNAQAQGGHRSHPRALSRRRASRDRRHGGADRDGVDGARQRSRR